DVAEFVADLRELNVTPHVAQNTTNRRSAIDGRTTRPPAMRSVDGCASASRRRLAGPRRRRLSQDPSPWSGPRRLDVHAHRHGLQCCPAEQAGGGRGVVTAGLCPESAQRQQTTSKTAKKPVSVTDSLQLEREFLIVIRQIASRSDFFRSLLK